MLAEDEDALTCDFQQYYNLNLSSIMSNDLGRASVLAWGLPQESRIKRLLSGQPVDDTTLLLAYMVDDLNFLVWARTKDGEKNKNRPKSIVEALYKEKEIDGYKDVDEYEKTRAKLIKDIKNGNNSR